MTNQQLIPTEELLNQWCYASSGDWREVAAIAARWGYKQGADEELEACVEWLGDAPVVYNDNGDLHPGSYLRDARRSSAPLECGRQGGGAAVTQEHPITPPPELVREWREEAAHRQYTSVEADEHIAEQAAVWGADMELEACCEWFADDVVSEVVSVVAELRAARRPEPQTLNSVALQMLGTIERDAHYIPEITDTIRRALEQLDD